MLDVRSTEETRELTVQDLQRRWNLDAETQWTVAILHRTRSLNVSGLFGSADDGHGQSAVKLWVPVQRGAMAACSDDASLGVDKTRILTLR